jgi:Reverse transcriptase (RNA-dependent DNA polymerase)
LPKGRKAIGCRWVFVIKHRSDDSVERYKARLVAQGYSQRPGLDYGETYAATVKWATLRAILALGAFEDLEMESVDISNAFLNGEMDTEVYMRQPEGFPQGSKDEVLQLKKGIYDTKQSPRLWHQKLDSVLSTMGFAKVQSDNALWVYQKESVRVILPVFVDDMTLVSKNKAAIHSTIGQLERHFKLRKLGGIEFLLGVKIERDRPNHTIHLSQKQYILNLLDRYSFSTCSPVSTPMNAGISLSEAHCPSSPEEVEEMRTAPYISAVGSLLYLAIATRPDIAYTVGVLARFNTNPGRAHWAAVKHLFRYLKGTMDYRLSFSPDSTTSELFVGYSDADHGADRVSRDSIFMPSTTIRSGEFLHLTHIEVDKVMMPVTLPAQLWVA